MTKKLKICLILLVVLGAVSAQRRPPQNATRTARRPQRPTGLARPFVEYDTWCEDNNVDNDRWFVHPWDCAFYIYCWDEGDGVRTFIDSCGNDEYFFQDDWRGTGGDNIYCVDPQGWVCPNLDIFWPPCPPATERDPVFHPSQQCDSYYFCV